MFFLPGNVITHRCDLREADGKDAVAILPREILQVRALCFDPERRTAFDLLDHFRRLASARQRRENVNMVFHAADDDGLAILIFEDATKVAV